ncbi:MAG: ribonuclease III [Bacteroidia bacterium]|nr:ribonuclease III [Bacteroidia bacterium]
MSTIKHLFSKNKDLSTAIKNTCGFYPSNINFYELAFTLSSQRIIVNGVHKSYERLEFLGDAILGTIISDFLYRRYPTRDEGFMSQMRSRVVSKESLSKISSKMGLDSLINVNLENNRNQKSIREDLFEALIGAIYMDKGYAVAQTFVLTRVLKIYIDFDEVETIDTDYKSQLIRYAQAQKLPIDFSILNDDIAAQNNKYTVQLFLNNVMVGEGTSFSKKKAEQIASQMALLKIEH